jgi:hypothetical protein
MKLITQNLDDLLVELNQLELIATVLLGFNSDVQSFKLKATTIPTIALEIKDLLGRSEYNAIQIQEAITHPDRLPNPAESWIDAGGAIHTYTEGIMVKGFTTIQGVLTITP